MIFCNGTAACAAGTFNTMVAAAVAMVAANQRDRGMTSP
jgi:hypothetical protein